MPVDPSVRDQQLPGQVDTGWTLLADVLLKRAVLRQARSQSTVEDQVLGLPGYRSEQEAAEIDAALAEDLNAALEQLMRCVQGDTRFAAISSQAGLRTQSLELFALVAAVDISHERRQLCEALLKARTEGHNLLLLLHLLNSPIGSGLRAARLLHESGLVEMNESGSFSEHSLALPWQVVLALTDPEVTFGSFGRSEIFDGQGRGDHSTALFYGGDRTRRRSEIADTINAPGFLVVPEGSKEPHLRAVITIAGVTGLRPVLELAGNKIPDHVRLAIDASPGSGWIVSSKLPVPVEHLPDLRWHEFAVETDPVSLDPVPAASADAALNADQRRLLERITNASDLAMTPLSRVTLGALADLATRLPRGRGWQDLVLAPEQERLLHDVVRRFRYRHRVLQDWGFDPHGRQGVTVLLSGISGAGKTLSAEVVANELGLDLYRVDLASMVSKYIGETEKNLERLFTAAETVDVVLLFDEADSLFGKRGEVGDAADRYANLETSYLLQRIESFDGVVFLTTNLASNMDSAFLRRIDVTINFGLPAPDLRRRLWDLNFPAGTYDPTIDFDYLAETFDLVGGAIRNTALAAAFLAAESNRQINRNDVSLALRAELTKNNRVVDEALIEGVATLRA